MTALIFILFYDPIIGSAFLYLPVSKPDIFDPQACRSPALSSVTSSRADNLVVAPSTINNSIAAVIQ